MQACLDCGQLWPSELPYCETCGAELAVSGLRFSRICRRKFDALSGEGELERFCETCQQTVYNLDPLPTADRLALLRRPETPCVSMSQPPSAAHPADSRDTRRRAFQLTGVPVVPPSVPRVRPSVSESSEVRPITASVDPSVPARPVVGRLVAGRVIVPLFEGRTFIGSGAESDVVVDDPRLSRRHCSVLWNGSEALLRDEGSTNGTFLNGEDLFGEVRRLASGDRVRVGELVYRVELFPGVG